MQSHQKVVIVGGGLSGWIFCSLILKYLKRYRHSAEIVLIESQAIAPIGVGEGTIAPLFSQFQDFLELHDRDFNHTFKKGVRYNNWYDDSPIQFNKWYHPFDFIAPRHIDPLAFPDLFAKYDSDEFKGAYVYHLDTNVFCARLRQYCTAYNNLTHIAADVVKVVLGTDKRISHIMVNRDGRNDPSTIYADFFVDCSGFKRVLASELPNSIIDYSAYLPCDCAIATHVPEIVDDIYQWTDATALSSGWSWRIPLRNKTGVGYVYSSDYINDDDAEAELRTLVEADFHGSVRKIKWRPSVYFDCWVNNCVAIGLASGFLEPLEATMIHTTLFQSTCLLDELFKSEKSNVFVSVDSDTARRLDFNNRVRDGFCNIASYISSHYFLSKRGSSRFWRSLGNEVPCPDDLKDILDTWKESPQSFMQLTGDIFGEHSLFKATNWTFMFKGMNFG